MNDKHLTAIVASLGILALAACSSPDAEADTHVPDPTHAESEVAETEPNRSDIDDPSRLAEQAAEIVGPRFADQFGGTETGNAICTAREYGTSVTVNGVDYADDYDFMDAYIDVSNTNAGLVIEVTDLVLSNGCVTGESTPRAASDSPELDTAGTASAIMPDVVGTDLQYARDTGVFYSRSEDASGDDRMQNMDRNWTVVARDPAPGTPIEEGEAILYVLKDDEL